MSVSPVIIDFFKTFQDPILLTFLPLLVALGIVRFTRINLRNFTGVYLLLGAGQFALTSALFGMSTAAVAGIALAVGVVVLLLAVGFIGKTQSAANYETLLAGIGLFPWYVGLEAGLLYVGIALAGIALIYVVRILASRKKFLQPLKHILKPDGAIPQAMHRDIWQEIRKALLPTPVAVASFVVVLVILFF